MRFPRGSPSLAVLRACCRLGLLIRWDGISVYLYMCVSVGREGGGALHRLEIRQSDVLGFDHFP